MDDKPYFAQQTAIWALSLLHLAKRSPEELYVCITENTPADHYQFLQKLNIGYQQVPVFDSRHLCSNKLAQLHCPFLRQADDVVLCDCDLAFVTEIDHLLSYQQKSTAIAAKAVDRAIPNVESWQLLLSQCGLNPNIPTTLATTTLQPTYHNNCNGGLYIMPQAKFREIGPIWRYWTRYLLDNPALVEEHSYFIDQLAFGMSMNALNDKVRLLNMNANFPTHLDLTKVLHLGWDPYIVHYHKRFDMQNYLHTTDFSSTIDAAIHKVNRMLKHYLPTISPYLPI